MLRATAVAAIAAAGIVILSFAMALIWPKPIIRVLAATSPDVLFFVQTDRPAVALTLDDGPHAQTTPAILDLLARYDAKATFFLIGDRVKGLEHVVKRILDEAHEIGNHGMREEPAVWLSQEDLMASMDSAAVRYGENVSPRWFRPGSGLYDRQMIDLSRSRGLRIVLGSVYPFDTTVESPAHASWFILRNVEPGSIVILHDHGENGRRTIETLERVLPELVRRGFEVVDLSTLAGKGAGKGRGNRLR